MVEAALAGRAERAGHAATGLAGDAQRRAIGVAHEHALDQRAVVCAPEGLAGGAVVAGHGPDFGQQRRHQLVDEPLPGLGRDVRHRVRVDCQSREVVIGQLLGTKGFLAEFDHGGGALGGREVGKVARREPAARRIENKGEGSHSTSSVPCRLQGRLSRSR